ncbi:MULTISPECIES: DUF397 domain-containing protein [Streptomyces]|uniref:DUF397 domain-containing protein n=1 Tax=Streptomyces edwardsiae TaxID=3075527 RepID=A0ABU2QMN4_9ACTN|nr:MULTISPECIES: DUF397 domain-containing protein [unclassified Streptomyces]MDT0405731.1 DUF397 domain-containing protein [Streptomyces sp. DSM 41635]
MDHGAHDRGVRTSQRSCRSHPRADRRSDRRLIRGPAQEGRRPYRAQRAPAPSSPVRDSKVPHGPALCFEVVSWAAFIGELKAGRHRV